MRSIGSVDTAYEPLLEKYIGHRVVTEFLYKDQPVEMTEAQIEEVEVIRNRAGGNDGHCAQFTAARIMG